MKQISVKIFHSLHRIFDHYSVGSELYHNIWYLITL